MLPAFPTGRQCTSGASPRASTISKAAVFWPSSRSGFTELTRATGYSLASLRTSSRQSSKLPSTCSSCAPCASAWASLPSAILPFGTRTAQRRPARAAYAAALADVLPVDAQITVRAPRAAASVTATVMPRSLNEPVGLLPSTLRYTEQPVSSDSVGAGSSGVPPSPRETTCVSGGTGSRSLYSPMIPRHGDGLVAVALTAPPALAGGPGSRLRAGLSSFALQALHPHDAVDVAHGLHRAESCHRLG